MRKRRKPKTSKRFSPLDIFRIGKSKRGSSGPSKVLGTLKFTLLICVLAGIGVGFVYLKQYVRTAKDMGGTFGNLELVNPPDWVNSKLEERMLAAVRAHGEDLRIDEEVAESVYRNITEIVPWLHDVRIQTTHDAVRVSGVWRKPLATLKLGGRQFYVDKDQTILEYIQLTGLPIVEIAGVPATQSTRIGQALGRQDVAAALDIITRLDMMDRAVTPDKPLLDEIASIDVSNFSGRKDDRKRHIILYARDKTEIMWGAEFGTWQRYMEVSDDEKLARLYSYYKDNGSLLTGVKYINLCDPQGTIPQPIDRYQGPVD